ncbi:MAG TPA: hypothetical protein VG142_05010 [Trebonia sp.]|jgi:hypothetical protein|nr:hypothetical protein [Trebonia sp.]
MTISVSHNFGYAVNSIEIHRPSHDVRILFRGTDVFEMLAVDVIDRLQAIVHLEIEDGGLSAVAPDLLLALWRGVLPESPEDEDGRYFESVLVAAPGYYG